LDQENLDVITAKVRLKVIAPIDDIAEGLLAKACKGNYIAAKLLLLVSGLQPAFEESRRLSAQ